MKQFVMNFLLVKNWNDDQIRRDELRQEVLFWKKLPLFLIFELTRCNSSGVQSVGEVVPGLANSKCTR